MNNFGNGISETQEGVDHELRLLDDREKILDQIIFRERQTFWKARAEELCDDARDGEELLERHENLLAISTFCRGIRADAVLSPVAKSSVRLPSPPFEFTHSLFDVMAGDMRPGTALNPRRALAARRLGFVEPDLIGEWFVLSLLRFPGQHHEDPHLTGGRSLLDPQGFVDFCWDQGDDRLVQFVQRCYQNHPDRVRDLGYLLPGVGRHIPRVAALVRAIFDEWRVRFDELGRDDEGLPRVGRDLYTIAAWAEHLFGILQEHIDGQEVSGSADDLLTITANCIHFSTWLGSDLVRAQASGMGQSVAANNAKTRGERLTWLERSKQIIMARLGRSASLREAFPGEGGQSEAVNAFSSAAERRAFEEVDDIPVTETRDPIRDTSDPVVAFRDKARRNFTTHSPAAQMRRDMTRQTGALPANSAAALSAKLLEDAAKFFRNIAQDNAALRVEMKQNAEVFDQAAGMMRGTPTGVLSYENGESTAIFETGAKLMRSAAAFFDIVTGQNPPFEEQMKEHAAVFRELAERLLKDPFKVVG